MEPIPALIAVGASYAAYLLGWRRVRVAQGRRKGPELRALALYDHRALARESASLGPDQAMAGGARLVPVPVAGALGPLPEPWASAGWNFARPSVLSESRDLLLLGLTEEAALRASSSAPSDVASLFCWAFFFRLFSGESERALAVAEAYASIPGRSPDVAARLLVQGLSFRAESLPPGGDREAVATRALQVWRSLEAPCGSPALSGLRPHLEILRLGWWNLEIGEWQVRRHLRRALTKHPEAPVLHLIKAHLAAVLGEGQRAADHLAKALYYARGDSFYALPIVNSPYLSLSRPTLAARARALVRENRSHGGPCD